MKKRTFDFKMFDIGFVKLKSNYWLCVKTGYIIDVKNGGEDYQDQYDYAVKARYILNYKKWSF